MYAIVTRYSGPTNSRGSRVIAIGATRRASVPYEAQMSSDEAHVAARNAWIKKHCDSMHVFVSCEDRLRWVIGTLPNGDTVHVAEFTPIGD